MTNPMQRHLIQSFASLVVLIVLMLAVVAISDSSEPAKVSAASLTVDAPDETTTPCGEGHGPETCYWQLGLRDDAYLRFEDGCEIGITVLADNSLRIRCEVRE